MPDAQDQYVMLTHTIENDVGLDRHTAHASAKLRPKPVALRGIGDAVTSLDDLLNESLRRARLVGGDIGADAKNVSRSVSA
jgi:hypothetical protein